MPPFSPPHPRRKSLRSSALVIVLMGIVLVSALTVTLFLVSRYEGVSARIALGKATSESLADLAAHTALLRIREATADGLSAGKMWVSEPGRIRVYERKNLSNIKDYELFSAMPGPDTATPDENNVDLNRRLMDGSYPIAAPASGQTQATMKIGWINLPGHPGEAPSATNPITGRIAFWVDDESCKVNINTADGSQKNTRESFGFGTPSEISLQALKTADGTPLTAAQARDIASYAWSKGFNSTAEIGRVASIPVGFYEANRFNITYYSKTPELTFYGEPRIQLLPTLAETNVTYTTLTGPYALTTNPLYAGSSTGTLNAQVAERIDFIYPTSRQLPTGDLYTYPTSHTYLGTKMLPQYPLGRNGQSLNTPKQTAANRSANFAFAYRIAQALDGRDSQDAPFDWPAFGAASASPATKYNVRQRDSIALQILDLSDNSVMVDHVRAFSLPTISHGILGNALSPTSRIGIVCGIGRTPKLTELLITVDTGTADPFGTGHSVPFMQPRIAMEFYFPKYYEGVPLENPYAGSDVSQWRPGNKDVRTKEYNDPDPAKTEPAFFRTSVMNEEDIGAATPKLLVDDITQFVPGEPSPLDPNTYWQNTLLRINGVDLAGNPAYSEYTKPNTANPASPLKKAMKDPSQSAASANHSYAATTEDGQNFFQGVQISRTSTRMPILELIAPSELADSWGPGVYHGQESPSKGTIPYFGTVGGGTFTIEGGVAFRSHTASGATWFNFEFAPLDSLRNDTYTGESVTTIKNTLMKAVIPVNLTAPDSYSVRVADPLVNKFPGDWIIDDGENTLLLPATNNRKPSIYSRGGIGVDPDFPSTTTTRFPSSFDGDNPEFRPGGGGDPLSLWMPRQDIRYPKQSRFPSVGALNYIRTGMIPDDLSVSLDLQKGVPFRSLNLSSESSSQGTYPDWAIFDLFTVPFVPQRPYLLGDAATPKRRLTYGGATEGKLNINNPLVPYPFGETVTGVSQVPPDRTAPLEALFLNIRTSTRYDSGGEPVYDTIDLDKAAEIRGKVQDYLAANGPFRLPGELAEVPGINDYTYTGVAANARSRNDLMREVIGATTTQSNIFSVWVVTQSIRKNPRNKNFGVYEKGDSILGETRRRYIIERHIDYGRDGVPGNAINPGTDGIVGTEDDPIDVNYHPALTYPLPYRWRIVAVENDGL